MAEKTIKSPYPGIFYRRPNPDSDLYVIEGDQVQPGDTVGFVEIMKNFYEVKSEESGVASTGSSCRAGTSSRPARTSSSCGTSLDGHRGSSPPAPMRWDRSPSSRGGRRSS